MNSANFTFRTAVRLPSGRQCTSDVRIPVGVRTDVTRDLWNEVQRPASGRQSIKKDAVRL